MKKVPVSIVLLLSLTGCGKPMPPVSDSTVVRVETTFVRGDLAAMTDTTDRTRMEKALADARTRAALVNSIIVSPTHVELRVGDQFDWKREITVTALDRDGNAIDGFAPATRLSHPNVLVRDGLLLRAVAAGETDLIIEPITARGPPQQPMAVVRFVVRPESRG